MPRAVFSMMRGGTALVDDAKLLRAARIDGLAGEQQVERGGRADELRQARHAAPGGNDAEHHLGQAEARPGSSTATR